MTQPPRNPHKIAFDKIADEAFAKTAAYLETLSGDEYKKARRIVQKLSGTNCYWYLYEFKPILLEALRSDDCRRNQNRA